MPQALVSGGPSDTASRGSLEVLREGRRQAVRCLREGLQQ